MCGRYLIDDEASAHIEIWMKNSPGTQLDYATGEIFPTNIAPVMTQAGAAAVKWGFPHWSNSSVIINARAETALEKNMFRKPLREQRCVILASGYYEWAAQGETKKKDKYLLHMPNDEILYMAGILNNFRDSTGTDYTAFVILTTDASNSISHIHNRMPLILHGDELDNWLSDPHFMEQTLHRSSPELSWGIAAHG